MPRANLVRYFGVFAPNARVRPAFRALLGFAVEQGLLEKAPNVGRVEEPTRDEELQFVSAGQTQRSSPPC